MIKLVSSDYSDIVIENMKTKYPDLKWVVSDVTNLKEFQNGQFDLVIEKGVMDALVVDEEDVWDPK